jgi:hypothetical protein
VTKKGETLFLPPSPGGSRPVLAIALAAAVAAAVWLRFELDGTNGVGLAFGLLLCLWLAYAYSPTGRRRLGLGLVLTPDGFAERGPFGGSHGRRWDEVASFEPHTDEGRETVAYRLDPARRRGLDRLSFGPGPDGMLALTYAMPPRALADLLESWRLRHAGKADALRALADDAL